jgi:glycine cleavage system aminomethyltransferase T
MENSFSILERGTAIAYVSAEHAKTGETLAVKIRDKLVSGEIVRFLFYYPTK